MILVDSNVLMYAAGAEHANKQPSVRFLERVARNEVSATVDAAVLQEVLHRYRAIGRWAAGRTLYDRARQLFPQVVPVGAEVLDHARHLMDECPGLMARDALHASVVTVHSLSALCSFDRDFDQVPGVVRVEPQDT